MKLAHLALILITAWKMWAREVLEGEKHVHIMAIGYGRHQQDKSVYSIKSPPGYRNIQFDK